MRNSLAGDDASAQWCHAGVGFAFRIAQQSPWSLPLDILCCRTVIASGVTVKRDRNQTTTSAALRRRVLAAVT